MKIHEVQENLRNTIAGKELLLQEYRAQRPHSVVREFLDVNIAELKRILADVDKAVEQYNELAWAISPMLTKDQNGV